MAAASESSLQAPKEGDCLEVKELLIAGLGLRDTVCIYVRNNLPVCGSDF